MFRAIARGKGGVNRELPRQAVSTVKRSPRQSTLEESTSDQLSLRNLLHVMLALEMIVSISCRKVSRCFCLENATMLVRCSLQIRCPIMPMGRVLCWIDIVPPWRVLRGAPGYVAGWSVWYAGRHSSAIAMIYLLLSLLIVEHCCVGITVVHQQLLKSHRGNIANRRALIVLCGFRDAAWMFV